MYSNYKYNNDTVLSKNIQYKYDNDPLLEKISQEDLPVTMIAKLIENETNAYFCSQYFSYNSILQAIKISPSFYFYFHEPTKEMTNLMIEFHSEYYEAMTKRVDPFEKYTSHIGGEELPF